MRVCLRCGAPRDERRHAARHTMSLQLGLEDRVDLRILVFILDLPTAEFAADRNRIFAAPVGRLDESLAVHAQGEIARWSRARVEVLVKPVLWWHDDRPRSPIAATPLCIALLPQQREAVT